MADRVLAWDAPNIDMTLSQLLGRRPSGPQERPEMRALLRWLAARRGPGESIEATVFVNVPPERPQALQGWVTFLTSIGYRVFARPKIEGSDIDDDMAAYLGDAARRAKEVIVGSTDARKFLEPVRDIATAGIAVTVLGFAEFAGELAEADGWEFVDLEDIPELLTVALPRTRLDQIPADGRWFEPRVSPEAAIASSPGADEAASNLA